MTQTKNGRIIKGVGGIYTVLADDVLYDCHARGLFRKQKIKPLPGDFVEFTVAGDGNCIVEIHPRKNSFVRPTVANLDRMFVITSISEPKPNTLVIDKMTALAQLQDVEVILVITKSDLGNPEPLASIYRKAGFRVLIINNTTGDGVADIAALLDSVTSVFTGNSGVGKSTLLNRLAPQLALETGEISNKLGRGRHTTRHTELFEVCGGFVADTPGFSSMDFDHSQQIPKENLAFGFREFLPYLADCKFSTCAHRNDKGCRITQAVADGDITRSRYESYCALYDDVKDVADWELRSRT